MRNTLNAKGLTILLLCAVCVFTLWSGISLAGTSKIIDSKHDLSSRIGGSGSVFKYKTVQTCVFCHTPHGADSTDALAQRKWTSGGYTGGGAPMLLWNRAFANAPAGYLMYQSSTLDVSGGSLTEVRVYSLLCLSCHDGVSALNIVYNIPADTEAKYGTDFIPPESGVATNFYAGGWSGGGSGWGPNIGDRTSESDAVNLSNDHPISFDYAAADLGLNSVAAVQASSLKLFKNPSGTDNISLECSTCHDVHNEGDKNAGTYPFLRMSNSGSAMCTTCHLK